MPKRPRPPITSSTSSDVPQPRHRRARKSTEQQQPGVPGPLAGLRIFIIDVKLQPSEPVTLRAIAERLDAAAVNACQIEDADVIVTRIAVSKRLARHIDLERAVSTLLELYVARLSFSNGGCHSTHNDTSGRRMSSSLSGCYSVKQLTHVSLQQSISLFLPYTTTAMRKNPSQPTHPPLHPLQTLPSLLFYPS